MFKSRGVADLICMFKSSLCPQGRKGGARLELGVLYKRDLLEDIGFEVQKLGTRFREEALPR